MNRTELDVHKAALDLVEYLTRRVDLKVKQNKRVREERMRQEKEREEEKRKLVEKELEEMRLKFEKERDHQKIIRDLSQLFLRRDFF